MKRQSILLLGIVAVLLAGTPATGDMTYNVIDLGTLGGDSSMALGINNHGQVVGQAGTGSGEQQPFLWQSGAISPLMNTGFNSGGALSINDEGVIVGVSANSNPLARVASQWTGGARSFLNIDSYQEGSAYKINNNGSVVGEVKTYGDAKHTQLVSHQAFLVENGTFTELGDFGLGYSYARSINESGQIVGTAYSSAEDGIAFLWEDAVMTDLGVLTEGGRSAANDINNKGQVVGHSQGGTDEYGNPGPTHGFRWMDGIMSDLGALNVHNEMSYADAINDLGQVVGYSVGAGWNPKAVLWDDDGSIFNLNDCLPAQSGWNLIYAFDINNNGQIVGCGNFAGEYHGFLMTPDGYAPPQVIPAPGAVVLGAIG
ncbi:MAG: DUF3466 family protein, partial [Sedimentisphaerales bacterium]|nr:DUF3466 family protein [Sedimentisphaerales bacterium]